MLPPVDLAWMQSDINSLMPDSCILMTRSTGSSSSGGPQATYTPTGTVNCRFDPLSERSRLFMQANNPLINAEGVLTLPFGTPLVAHSHLSLNGHIYEVLDAPIDRSWALDVRGLIAKAT